MWKASLGTASPRQSCPRSFDPVDQTLPPPSIATVYPSEAATFAMNGAATIVAVVVAVVVAGDAAEEVPSLFPRTKNSVTGAKPSGGDDDDDGAVPLPIRHLLPRCPPPPEEGDPPPPAVKTRPSLVSRAEWVDPAEMPITCSPARRPGTAMRAGGRTTPSSARCPGEEEEEEEEEEAEDPPPHSAGSPDPKSHVVVASGRYHSASSSSSSSS